MKVFFIPLSKRISLGQDLSHFLIVVVRCAAPEVVTINIAEICQLVMQTWLATSSFRTLTTEYCPVHVTSLFAPEMCWIVRLSNLKLL